MSFYRFVFNYLKQYSVPVFKSFFKAYKDTTAGAKSNKTGNQTGGEKQHFSDRFSSMMSQTNLSAPPITPSTALEILNIQKSIQEVQHKMILQRYYTLFNKNDPKIGGTTYLQSKVFAAKQCLMQQYQNATELEHQFYKEVIQPTLKQQTTQQQKKSQQTDENTKK